MLEPLKIRKVETNQDYRAFLEFPWQLYKNDPNWVPPLVSMRRDLLDKKKNSDWSYMEGDYFGAWRGDQLVGTIAAFVNHRHNEANHENIGWFGAFDVNDDQEAACGLLGTATEWAQSRGYDAIVGPQTFSSQGDCGVLIDGFTRPILLMPYNYPYYGKLVECAGFQKREDLYSFHLSREHAIEIGLVQRLQRITKSVTKRSQITIRPIDRRHLHEEFELFKELYNTAFSDTWGFFPISPAELDALVATLGRYFDPDFAFFAFVKDQPVGFIMGVPDIYQVLHRAGARPGLPEPLVLLRALWYWKVARVIDWIRIALLGVKPEYRGKGVDVALYGTLLEACVNSTQIKHSDSGWVSEKNVRMAGVAHSLGLDQYKTYRLYEKQLHDSRR